MTTTWTNNSKRGDMLHVMVDGEVFTFAFNHNGSGAALMVQTMLRRMHEQGEITLREVRR